MNFTDKKALKAMQDELAAAMTEICARHGVSVKPAGGRITSGIEADLKFNFRTIDKDAMAAEEKAQFSMYAHLYGLLPTDYGMPFKANGKTWHVVGFNHKRPKFCIRVRDEQGKEMLFSDAVVAHIIRARPAKEA